MRNKKVWMAYALAAGVAVTGTAALTQSVRASQDREIAAVVDNDTQSPEDTTEESRLVSEEEVVDTTEEALSGEEAAGTTEEGVSGEEAAGTTEEETPIYYVEQTSGDGESINEDVSTYYIVQLEDREWDEESSRALSALAKHMGLADGEEYLEKVWGQAVDVAVKEIRKKYDVSCSKDDAVRKAGFLCIEEKAGVSSVSGAITAGERCFWFTYNVDDGSSDISETSLAVLDYEDENLNLGVELKPEERE